MTIIWLIVWLIKDTPQVQFASSGSLDMNNWAVALVICLFIDLFLTSRR